MSQVTGNGTSLEQEKGKVRVKGGKRGSSSGKFRKVFTRKISLKIKDKKYEWVKYCHVSSRTHKRYYWHSLWIYMISKKC